MGFDHSRSKQVIAFWIWLERDGFSHFVYNLLALPDSSLHLLAIEAMGCLFLLQEGLGPPLITTDDKYIPLMRQLLSKDFSFTSLYEKRQSAISSIEGIIQNVCEIAFCDIVEPNLTDITRQYCFQPQESAFCPQYSSHYILTVLPRDRAFLLSANMDQEELEDLIAREFGNCVEAVYMEYQPPLAHPLSASVVFRYTSYVDEIFGGKKLLVKFSANGKFYWVRRLDSSQPFDPCQQLRQQISKSLHRKFFNYRDQNST
ncbi:uncharacterized protein LOC132163032 [Corylus avellana]|uniref:uncharacterized protein LOC132163032 n=1 Tax=Corylus avellana TaxID=13451 RepID=UPI00286D6809|nr:uncharacterized protein LOC132163032 [Corylus avellana]